MSLFKKITDAFLAAKIRWSGNAKTRSRYTSFSDYPAYDGTDLELKTDSTGTHFALWSPEAEAVELILYNTGRNTPPFMTLPMEQDSNGVWRTAVSDLLYGKFYTFRIKHTERWLAETPGVWAKAVGVNGQRAAIIDFTKTNPEGWEADKGPQLRNITDAIIYEMHIRDFSISPTSGIANKGKFLSLTEPETTSPYGDKTGIDHLKQLGVTHIHLMPAFDFNSVDETNLPSNQYNWGYDPLNYNVPEGSYSTNPSDPATRIREMKEMIKYLHNNGIGLIMDVVYNHTADTDTSNFSLTAPGYYYRQNSDGSLSNASGCGNETASERQQMRHFIVNSVKYWTEEYHIDGFRFDLMAVHDIDTMNEVASELRKLNPHIIIYGEGWTAGDSPLPYSQRAYKESAASLHGTAIFSDDLRDALKGRFNEDRDRGFVAGKPGCETTVKIGIVAATAHPQIDFSKGIISRIPYAKSPCQVINYVSCHDGLTLADKLAASMHGSSEAQRKRAARLAQTIVFTSQGTPFMLAGEEMFRDKKGDGNSYKSPDSVNAIDWTLKHVHADLFDYYRKLISLRRQHPAFRMTSADDIARHLKFDEIKIPNVISYSLTDHANGDYWREIKLIFNGNPEPVTVNIPQADWIIIAADGRLNPDGIGSEKGGCVTVAPVSSLILAQ